uniref:Uncharacterized protein n=1 Tax=Stereomyxa ramosa TaxID=1078864 RepID=A0A7S2ABH4_9EUKA
MIYFNMISLVFPKFFEFFKFFNHLLQNHFLFDISYKNDCYYLFVNNRYPFIVNCYVVGDSDIEFNQLISKIIHGKNHDKLILIGSCGSDNEKNLGKMFLVKKAIKGDRGTLDSNNVFRIRKDKLLETNYKINHDDLLRLACDQKNIISTNFLNENIIDNSFEGNLFDMETFDFYDICDTNDIKEYYSLRFVTDLVLPIGGNINIEDYKEIIINNDSKNEKLHDLGDFKSLRDLKKYYRMRCALEKVWNSLLNLKFQSTKLHLVNTNSIQFYEGYFRRIYNKLLSKIENTKYQSELKMEEDYLDHYNKKRKNEDEIEKDKDARKKRKRSIENSNNDKLVEESM